MSDRATSLYRLYDGAGALLYVGIAYDPAVRWQAHARKKAWWTEVARAEIEHFASRDQAIEAEQDQIRRLRPRHNWTHNDRNGYDPSDPRVRRAIEVLVSAAPPIGLGL